MHMTHNIQIRFIPLHLHLHPLYIPLPSPSIRSLPSKPQSTRFSKTKTRMRLNALSLFTITLTLTTAHALPSTNGIGPMIIEPVDERTNRFVGPGSDLEKCGSDMDCQFLSVRLTLLGSGDVDVDVDVVADG